MLIYYAHLIVEMVYYNMKLKNVMMEMIFLLMDVLNVKCNVLLDVIYAKDFIVNNVLNQDGIKMIKEVVKLNVVIR